MEAQAFYERIGLVERLPALNKKLDKKMFYDFADINRKEKNIIKKYVDRMELTFLLIPSTINIQAFINEEYHYEGVQYVTVRLRNNVTDKQIQVLEEVIHGALPNPVVLIFSLQDELMVSTCLKRLNKVNKSQVVLDEIHHTGWFQNDDSNNITAEFLKSIRISNLSFFNFYKYYKEIDIAVKAYQDAGIVGSFEVIKEDEERQRRDELIKKVEDLEQEKNRLMKVIKRESQFNKKVELNMKVQQLNKEMERIKASL